MPRKRDNPKGWRYRNKSFTVMFTPKEREKLTAIAKELDVDDSELVRRWVDKYRLSVKR